MTTKQCHTFVSTTGEHCPETPTKIIRISNYMVANINITTNIDLLFCEKCFKNICNGAYGESMKLLAITSSEAINEQN